ncbi:MAG TPA: recombinase family protein [Solirubrobacterales bacterium]|nr:recombinase family protein [Solirubrobacterales bacterium]
MKLDGYIRVSKVGGREGDSFISPEVQEGQIAAWGKLRGVEIVMQKPDLDRSGRVLSRPSLDLIMERIKAGETDGIAVARIDRLSRAGTMDALRLIGEIAADGGRLAVIDLGIDPTTPLGEFALTLVIALAHMRSREIGENWYIARKLRIEKGGYVGGFVPPGYVKGEDKRLQPDPDMADPKQFVTEFFRRRASRTSWGKLADWTSGQLGYNVSAPTVRNMIKNRTYLGESHGGQGLVNTTAHKPLVSLALFEAANSVEGVVPARSGRSSSVLSGIARCAGCRYAMKATMNKSRHGKPFLELRCKAQARERTTACDHPAYITASRLEKFVLERFLERIGEYRLRAVDRTSEVAELEGRLVEAEAELRAALDTRLAEALGGDGDPRYLEVVSERREAVDSLQEAVAGAEDLAVNLPDVNLAEVWSELELEDQRRLLRSALDCVFVRRGDGDVATRVHFCWRGEAPELPQPGRRWTPQPFDFPG